MQSFHSLTDTSITKSPVDFSMFKGKVCLVMNSACGCKLAKEGFRTARTAKKDFPNIEILFFPSALNSAVDQEKKTEEEIIERLKEEEVYDISTVFEKRIASKDTKALNWLCEHAPGILGTKMLKWNFTKFLVAADGTTVKRFSPTDKYEDISPSIEEFMKKSISQKGNQNIQSSE